jgi:hypothetical protein
MENSRMQSILSDISESLDQNELDAIVADLVGNEETARYAVMEEVMEACEAKSGSFEEKPAEVALAAVAAEVSIESVLAEIAALKRQLAAAAPKVDKVVKYKLLKDDVKWSTTPQVHATMRILRSIVDVGGEFIEADAIAAMEANVALLSNTRQGGRKIWDYYKSRTIGLQAHGNIVRVL